MRPIRRQRGFSVIEMIVAVSILVIVAGIAMPKMLEAIDDMRLRSSATDLAGLMQRARILAIKNNSYYPIKYVSEGGSLLFYIDTSPLSGSPNRNTNTVYSNSFPSVQLGSGVVRASDPDTSGATPWGFSALPPTDTPYWGNSGLPCIVSGATCVSASGMSGTTVPAYIFFLSDNRRFGTPGYVAVAVSPAGRVSIWRWNGTVWQD